MRRNPSENDCRLSTERFFGCSTPKVNIQYCERAHSLPSLKRIVEHGETEPETTNFFHTPLYLVYVQRTFFRTLLSINLFIHHANIWQAAKNGFVSRPTLWCVLSLLAR